MRWGSAVNSAQGSGSKMWFPQQPLQCRTGSMHPCWYGVYPGNPAACPASTHPARLPSLPNTSCTTPLTWQVAQFASNPVKRQVAGRPVALLPVQRTAHLPAPASNSLCHALIRLAASGMACLQHQTGCECVGQRRHGHKEQPHHNACLAEGVGQRQQGAAAGGRCIVSGKAE